MLFIIRAVSHLREYLEGKEFITESDHFPLQWLNKMRGQNQRLHQRAFDALKRLVTSYPVLRNTDFSKPFVLQTDSSDRGIGAVLLQEHQGKKLPVMFISKKLLHRERQYSTIEKECLAIYYQSCISFT